MMHDTVHVYGFRVYTGKSIYYTTVCSRYCILFSLALFVNGDVNPIRKGIYSVHSSPGETCIILPSRKYCYIKVSLRVSSRGIVNIKIQHNELYMYVSR